MNAKLLLNMPYYFYSGNWHYLAKDGLGNVRAVHNDALNEVYSAQYAPYGDPFDTSGANPTPFGYTGEPTDTNDLVHLRARYYDPALGVFNSLDPLETANRYSYVNSNPTNRVDPSGLTAENPLNYSGCMDQDSPCIVRFCNRYKETGLDGLYECCVQHYTNFPETCRDREVYRYRPFGCSGVNLSARNLSVLIATGADTFILTPDEVRGGTCYVGPISGGIDEDSYIAGGGVSAQPFNCSLDSGTPNGITVYLSAGGLGIGWQCSCSILTDSIDSGDPFTCSCSANNTLLPDISFGVLLVIPEDMIDDVIQLATDPNTYRINIEADCTSGVCLPSVTNPFVETCRILGICK